MYHHQAISISTNRTTTGYMPAHPPCNGARGTSWCARRCTAHTTVAPRRQIREVICGVRNIPNPVGGYFPLITATRYSVICLVGGLWNNMGWVYEMLGLFLKPLGTPGTFHFVLRRVHEMDQATRGTIKIHTISEYPLLHSYKLSVINECTSQFSTHGLASLVTNCCQTLWTIVNHDQPLGRTARIRFHCCVVPCFSTVVGFDELSHSSLDCSSAAWLGNFSNCYSCSWQLAQKVG